MTNVLSVLPGLLVQSLVTAVVPDGLNLQILGFFEATIDEFHLPNTHKALKVGEKVKARVLYDLPGTTSRFVVTLAEHHIRLQPKSISGDQLLCTAFPVGTVFDSVKLRRVEAERGLLVEIQPNQEGFVHVSIPMSVLPFRLTMPRSHKSPMSISLHCLPRPDHGK